MIVDTTASDRRIAVSGTYNLRDVGGYRAGTSLTKWGRLFRSDALHNLDDAGQAAFAAIGIDHIIDLRSDDERASAPSRLVAPALIHHLPVFAGAAPTAMGSRDITLASLYDHIVDERAARLVESIRLIASTDPAESVLVHCTAGKDRTGLVIAFALAASGVDRDDVVDDYAATAGHLAGEWVDRMLASVGAIASRTPPQAVVDLVSSSPAAVMSELLDRVDLAHGSVADYLIVNGLDATDIDRLAVSLIA